jgi:von Willebrand factor type A domain
MQTKHTIAHSLFSLIAALPLYAEPAATTPPKDPTPSQEKVQIALLLDTSSSMDGLIDQARTQLWKVVNTFVDAKRDGATPFVEVALYEYGNNALSVDNQYVRQVKPLTRDLDDLSQKLFALKTDGGEEYCGAVIKRSLSDLAWDSSPKTYKAIFVAGNESFTQGSVDARQACKEALAKHIIINTIHCGSRDEGISGSWNDGAALAEGKFMIIDQDRAVAHVDAPQDKEISDLSLKLNKTYIGYGSKREDSRFKQLSADTAAAASPASGAAVERAITKANTSYSNSSWDLVDALREKKVNLEKCVEADLPNEMKALAPAARVEFVEKAARERTEIQSKIMELNKSREAYVAEELKKQANSGLQTLDQALIETARKQATKLGYTFTY